MAVFGQLKQSQLALSLPEISVLMAHSIPERTLRRWLHQWVDTGILQRTGQKRGTRYLCLSDTSFTKQYATDSTNTERTFLDSVAKHKRSAVLAQIRDLWTHSSTALEGNTLTLGDTHAILGLGLTISGKPLKEHLEVFGHAKAIDILYQSLQKPLCKTLIYELHKAVQTEIALDIYKPIGAWKVEPNGTYAVTSQAKQVFIEYAHPLHVDALMNEVIEMINTVDIATVTINNAAYYYAKVHMAIVHIHPFWDGNGRIARLLANIILLKASLPPLVIEISQRREYIECLADYQVQIGQLSNTTGVWPNDALLKPFTLFCQQSYVATKNLIAEALCTY
ncbi:hypothetical protein AU255_07990 [Methyloprofundus sedimenti]|uniref:Fido domain-containing protein n=2 Tax=Methyloprofundus sedimenti TaxID=1420851 RepID=A0A1V8M895_9GAMM|nr:hypothetical protein AU255_07990 [Methyloprofundus sedimenti]